MCHLISDKIIITNKKNGKSITVKSNGNCKSEDVIYAARCKICDLIYVGETKDSLKKRFSGHRSDSKNRPENCDLPEHIHEHGHDFEKDIEVSILKQGFKSAAERKMQEDKFICLLGTLNPTGLNTKLGQYAKDMYDTYQQI